MNVFDRRIQAVNGIDGGRLCYCCSRIIDILLGTRYYANARALVRILFQFLVFVHHTESQMYDFYIE